MTQYMPAKPAKFGIKIFWICDAANGYALAGEIYAGKEGNTITRGLAERVAKSLAIPFHNTGRTLTMDNYFTSLPLVDHFAANRLTVVGTLRANKPELPAAFKNKGTRALYSSMFGFRQNVMLVSYVARKNKVVNLLSSRHRIMAVDGIKQKPEVVQYYNKTKIGVDIMDQKVANYSSKRKSRRWPMVIWANIVDVAALNAQIIFHLSNPNVNNHRSDKRRLFLIDLGVQLALPAMRSRLMNSSRLSKETLAAMKVFGVQHEPEQLVTGSALLETQKQLSASRVRCYKCTNDRKTKTLCQQCHRPVCGQHSRNFCELCVRNRVNNDWD